MNQKLFSILTPTHNRAKDYLPQTILSVMNQKQNGFDHQHIIVDNLSTDNTEKVVKKFAKKDKRIIYVKNSRNLGAADALNVAFKKSRGGLIVPLDDDDILPKSSLAHRFAFHQANSKVKWTYGDLLFIDQNNRLLDGVLEYRTTYIKHKTYLLSLLGRNFIPNGTVTFWRECLDKVGGWDPNIKTQDFDLWLKFAHAGFVPVKIDSYLSLYRLHKRQATKKQMADNTYVREREYYLKLYGVKESQLTRN